MARYHVKGTVYLTVTNTETETERIDDTFEADDEDHAQRLAEQQAEDEYSSADRVEVDDSRLTITIIEETQEEREQRISLATYQQMRRMKAPQLPGMGTY